MPISAGSRAPTGIATTLATAAGATGKTWRAYLSTQGANAVNAKDRIGRGPWQNAKGTVVAKDVADLHGASNNLNKQTALNEKGEVINGRGDTPNRHDILTGSQSDGTAFAGARRPHLRQLDQERRGRRDGRPSRPSGPQRVARRCCRGIPRIPRAGRTAAAARPT